MEDLGSGDGEGEDVDVVLREIQGPVSRWRRIRNRLYQEICRRGFHRSLGSFVQSYGRERWTRHRS